MDLKVLLVAFAVLVLTSTSAQEQQQCSTAAGLVPGNGAATCIEGYTLCSGQCLRCPSSYTFDEQLGKCVPPCDAVFNLPSTVASKTDNVVFERFSTYAPTDDRPGKTLATVALFPDVPCSGTCLESATIGKIYPPGGTEAKQTLTLHGLRFQLKGGDDLDKNYAANVTITGFAPQQSMDGTGMPPQYQPVAVIRQAIRLTEFE